MVTEKAGYIGTSNWAEDYFTDTAGKRESSYRRRREKTLLKFFSWNWFHSCIPAAEWSKICYDLVDLIGKLVCAAGVFFPLIRLLTYRLLSISTVSREFGKISLEKNRNKFYLFLWIHYVQYIGIVQLTSNTYIFSFIHKWYVRNGFSSGIVHQFCKTFNLPFTKQDLFWFYSAMFMKYTSPGHSLYSKLN